MAAFARAASFPVSIPISLMSGRPPGVSLAIMPPLTSTTVFRPATLSMVLSSDRSMPMLTLACPS